MMNAALEDLVFSLLERTAATGGRCPTNPELASMLREHGWQVGGTSMPKLLKRLTQAGKIVIRVYGNNWRDVTICGGRHSGKATLPPPHGGKPYLTMDARGRSDTRPRPKRSAEA